MRKRRILALLLALCMVLGVLAGCSDKKDTNTPGDGITEDGTQKPSSGQSAEAAKQTSAKYVYKTQFVPIELPLAENEGLNYLNIYCTSGNYLYLTAEIGDTTPPTTDTTVPDGSEVPAEPEEEPSEGEGSIDDEMGVMPLDETAEDAVTEDTQTDEIVADEAPASTVEAPGTEFYNYETRVYRYDLTQNRAEEIPGFVPLETPEGYTNGWTYIQQFLPGSNGSIWIADSSSCYKIVFNPDGEDIDGVHYAVGDYVSGPTVTRLQQLSPTGEVLHEKTTIANPNDTENENSSRNLSTIDRNDHLYYYDWNSGIITIEDIDGNVLKSFDEQQGGYLTTFCDQPALEIYDETTYESSICPIDIETLEIGEKIERPANSWSFSTSYDEAYDFYYEYNGSLYGYKQQEKVSEQVVSWLDCDVNSNSLYSTIPLEDGRILGVLYEWDNSTSQTNYSLVFLTKADASEVKPKTVFTLACMYFDWTIQNAIIEFNRASEDYRIIVNDYSQYATQDDYEAGVTKLNTEIMSGKVPDLLYTYNIPISKYAAQGVLTDLKPYIDADPELNGDQLMTHVFDAASENGKLYQVFSTFTIDAPTALDKVVGEYSQWTLAEMKDALTKLQPGATVFGVGVTRSTMLTRLLERNFASYVNWTTGECGFDSQDFRDLLEFVNSFPDEYTDEDWTSETKYGTDALLVGQQLMNMSGLYSLSDYAWLLGEFRGQDFSYIGYPSASGNYSSFQLGDGLSISATCADIDGAWQFVRKFLTKEYQEQNAYSIPTNKAVFDEQIRKMTTIEYETDYEGNYVLDENGGKIVVPKAYVWDNETGERADTIDVLTQADIDKIMALYESTTSVSGHDKEILEIVEEVAAGYFGGQTSLDETVRVLQNRVSLFVAERI